MSDDKTIARFRFLISQIIDGGLSPSESNELQNLVQSQPELFDHAADQLILDSMLAEELGTEPMKAFVDIVSETNFSGVTSAKEVDAFVQSSQRANNWLSHPSTGLRKPAYWMIAASLLMIGAFFAGRWDSNAFASSSSILRAALATHSERIERVYVVEYQRENSALLGFNPPKDVRVMTQGDRFWVEMNRNEKRWTWGREADGSLWLAFGQKRAIRIGPDEVGQPLQYLSSVYSLNLETILGSILKEFHMTYSDGSDTTHVITAKPKKKSPSWLHEIVIEVDKETKTVRRLLIRRSNPALGESSVNFTLVDSRFPDESMYRAEGHLSESSNVLSIDSSLDKRREILMGWFGGMAERWIKSRD
jgi:hypothetical protein